MDVREIWRRVNWAYQVPLEGKSHFVDAQRRLLLYMASTGTVGADGKLRVTIYDESPRGALAEELGIGYRRLMRVIKALSEQGLVEKDMWDYRTLYVNIHQPREGAQRK